MAFPLVLSPDTAYSTKPNIAYPASQTLATAAEVRASARLQDVVAAPIDGITLTVGAGAIEVANP